MEKRYKKILNEIPPIGGVQTWLYRSYLKFFKANINCWRKSWNKVNDLDLKIDFYLAGVKMDYLKLSTCIIKPRPGENEIGLKAYKSKPDDYLKNMNLNNKRNLSNKEIKNKTYKDTYFKWSKIIDSNLKSLNILDSDLGESIFINMNVSDVKIEKVLCWNSLNFFKLYL